MADTANTNRLNSAATDGLLLSTITIAASLIQSLSNGTGMMLSTLLWMAKFGGCIYLLTHIMRQYSQQYDTVSYLESFKYGFLVCIFSSIVCAGYMLLSLTYLFPEQIDIAIEQINTVMQSGAYSSDDLKIADSMIDKLPKLTFITSFIYYTVIGAVMSSIIANFTKKD